MVHRIAFRLALPALMLAGCAAPAPSVRDTGRPSTAVIPTSPLQGFRWRAVEIGGQPVVAGSEVYIRFAGETVQGHAGCNGFGGRHRLEGPTRISFGTLASTRMGCFSDEIADQEARFHRLLRGSVNYAVEARGPEDVRLTLRVADGGSLVFRREPWTEPAPKGPPPPPFPRTAQAAILDRDWQAVTIFGTPVAAGSAVSLRFAGGRVTGHGGCNQFSGAVDFDPGPYEQKLRFGALAATRMACADPRLQAQEQALLEALRGTFIYSIDARGVLTLTAANTRTIVLRPAG